MGAVTQPRAQIRGEHSFIRKRAMTEPITKHKSMCSRGLDGANAVLAVHVLQEGAAFLKFIGLGARLAWKILAIVRQTSFLNLHQSGMHCMENTSYPAAVSAVLIKCKHADLCHFNSAGLGPVFTLLTLHYLGRGLLVDYLF